jgi:molybdopterin molybdotransferase
MLSVEEAQDRIIAAARPTPAEQIGLADALGRVLAEDLAARRTQPPMDVSAMDGYAVRAEDVATVPVTLKIVGHAPAGDSHDDTVGPGEAVRIFTGGPVPDGADSIVIQEDTESDGKTVTIKESVKLGNYVRPAGLDFREGDLLLESGRLLSVRDVGLAAAMNRPWLMVRRKPRITILATGDEVSSNGLALSAAVRAFGGEPVLLGIAPDDRDALARMAAGAAGSEMLLTTGGVSVGEHDLVQSVLGDEGLEVDFWRIAMRPGKPLMFGHIGDTMTIGLPGNPVSTLVCAMIFVQPAIRRMLGLVEPRPYTVKARLAAPLPQNDRRQDYLRSTSERDAHGALRVTSYEKQDSSMMAPLAKADCLIVRPPHAEAANAGDIVDVIPMPSGMVRV